MRDIKVLGMGCANCKNTVKLIEDVAREKKLAISLEKVEDIQKIMTYNIISTPAVILDGQIVHTGGIPSRSKVEGWFSMG